MIIKLPRPHLPGRRNPATKHRHPVTLTLPLLKRGKVLLSIQITLCDYQYNCSKEVDEIEQLKTSKESQKILTDETYDLPRSHFVEGEATLRKGRHCYNNAVPVSCVEGTIFRYDISPKPGTSTSTTVSTYSMNNRTIFFYIMLYCFDLKKNCFL